MLLLGALSAPSFGCSSDCTGPGCGTCRDEDCSDGQRCVQGECQSACGGDEDCSGGLVCRAYEFTPGDVGNRCVRLDGAAPGAPGRFSPCSNDDECDGEHGFSCVDGECSYECRSHSDCVAVGHCDVRTVDDVSKRVCIRDATSPQPGGLYTSCPDGDECSEPTLCIGAGPGDLDAYCSVDCESDEQCGLGYYCGSITRAPCADACGLDGQPLDARCAPVEQIGPGLTYRCGDSGPERKVCRQREFCSPCESDADCLAVPGQVCARDQSGEKICTRLCDTEVRSCPWGNAARCGIFDDELGVPTCSHRFGACFGSGQTCEPCRSNDDCPDGVCAGSPFTGERWCIDFTARCECKSGVDATGTCLDGGCPDSPGGLPVACIGERSSQLFNTCYAANTAGGSLIGSASPQTGCWPGQ